MKFLTKKILFIIFFLTILSIITIIIMITSTNNNISLKDANIKTDHFTLDNGMEVIIIPNHRVAGIMHMVWYKVGSINEQEGKTGLAHYLEHLMFHGTTKYPKDEIDKQISGFGGTHNAFTSNDFTAYYQNIPKDYLEKVMDMESDRMRNLILEEKQTEIEKNIVLEERLMRRDNSPKSVLGEKVRAGLFGKNHPYGKPIIGFEEDIKNFTFSDALDFYNKYYFPNNAILVLAGDITKKDALPLINKYYTKLEKGENLEVQFAEEIAEISKKKVEHYDKNTKDVTVSLSYLAPDLLSKKISNKNIPYSLTLLAYLLGGNKNSILYKKLALEKNLVLNVSSSYSDMSRGQSSFDIYFTLKKS